MKVARLFSLVLVAVVALSAMVASTASAIPKFKLPITKRNFTAESKTSTLAVGAETDIVTCPSSKSNGTILGDDEISVDILYTGCALKEKAGGECKVDSGSGAKEPGLIITSLLTGLLGLVLPGGAAGILFEPTTGDENSFVKLLPLTGCTGANEEKAVEGSVAGVFTPTGKSSKTAEIILTLTGSVGARKQAVTQIDTLLGLIKPKLTSFGALASVQLQTAVVTFEENVEVD